MIYTLIIDMHTHIYHTYTCAHVTEYRTFQSADGWMLCLLQPSKIQHLYHQLKINLVLFLELDFNCSKLVFSFWEIYMIDIFLIIFFDCPSLCRFVFYKQWVQWSCDIFIMSKYQVFYFFKLYTNICYSFPFLFFTFLIKKDLFYDYILHYIYWFVFNIHVYYKMILIYSVFYLHIEFDKIYHMTMTIRPFIKFKVLV